MKRDYIDYINDILGSIDEIAEFIEGMDYDTFAFDKKTRNAVIRSLEVVGEASAKIPEDTRERYPEIPWKYMTGMRNKLIHEYFGIDLEIVWEVSTNEVPPLKPLLQNVLDDLVHNPE
ncbi:MAG: DUF86 domain-containing protein [Candidatus Aminicenantes bacterium]|nr:DUF86 domain-containing protein [Candidatus Aminicenantes bacterium]